MKRTPSKYATTSEAEIRALVAQGLNFVQIAAKLNVNVLQLRAVAQVLGIRSGYHSHLNVSEKLEGWVKLLEKVRLVDSRATART